MTQSFEPIRAAKPPKLFVAADGPREGREDEADKCAVARRIVDQVDWPCEVHTLFRDENLGCRKAVSEAITWFFEHVEEGIILEDDCVADPTFFPFCEELLERYRDDERIMTISGDNYQPEGFDCGASYYFSKYPHCWGWATWRNRWKKYDDQMSDWPAYRLSQNLKELSCSKQEARYWCRMFERCYEKELDSWATVWVLTCWSSGALTILPNVNLVNNIGDGVEATHTSSLLECQQRRVEAITFPLVHPTKIYQNKRADRYTDSEVFSLTPRSISLRFRKIWWGIVMRFRNAS